MAKKKAAKRKKLSDTISMADKFFLCPIAKIKIKKGNPRVHSPAQLDHIEGLIKRFGFLIPVLLGENNELIAGHGRVEVARDRLRMKSVPAIMASHLTEAERRAFRMADNKSAEVGVAWDEMLLGEEMLALRTDGVSIDDLGWTDDELDDLLPDLEAEADEILAEHGSELETEASEDESEEAGPEEHGAGESGLAGPGASEAEEVSDDPEADQSDADAIETEDDSETDHEPAPEPATEEIRSEIIGADIRKLPTHCPHCHRPMEES